MYVFYMDRTVLSGYGEKQPISFEVIGKVRGRNIANPDVAEKPTYLRQLDLKLLKLEDNTDMVIGCINVGDDSGFIEDMIVRNEPLGGMIGDLVLVVEQGYVRDYSIFDRNDVEEDRKPYGNLVNRVKEYLQKQSQ